MWKCSKCGKKVDDAYEICWACGTSVEGVEDPTFLEERDWEKHVPAGPEANITPESLVNLVKCNMPAQAHAIRVRLESEGIPVFLFDEFTISMDWLLSNAIGGVKVQVPEPYLERARAIMGIVEEQMEEETTEEEEDYDDDDEGDEFAADSTEESHESNDEGIVDLEKPAEAPATEPTDEGIIDKKETP